MSSKTGKQTPTEKDTPGEKVLWRSGGVVVVQPSPDDPIFDAGWMLTTDPKLVESMKSSQREDTEKVEPNTSEPKDETSRPE